MKPVITLTTDFGSRDYFVGSVKGVILQINPDIRIVDISHEIAPYAIRDAAFVIAASYRYFPKGSVHMVVVDPGVGSERRPLLVVSRSGFFLAPDNGVLSHIFEEDAPFQAFEITENKFFLKQPGNSFHGRDIFAPVAGWLSTELEPATFGRLITDPVRLPEVKPVLKDHRVTGKVIYTDHYGNLITNIRYTHIPSMDLKKLRLEVGSHSFKGGKRFYQETKNGEISFTLNSSGNIEIFKCQGSAAKTLALSPEDAVLLYLE